MPLETPNERNATLDAASRVTETISEAASAAKSTVADFGRTVVAKADENRDAAARGLQTAASTLHQQADSLPGGEKVTGLAHSAADTLTSTADYVRAHDVSGMMADLERLVKNNPGPSLLAAAAIGFLVARTLSTSD
jgi:ElaB/YqjD/DUF883 family membrane-anchored ribosome-binding protein